MIKQMFKKLNIKEKILGAGVAVVLILAFLANVSTYAATNLSGGDIFRAKNLTNNETSYHEGVSAKDKDRVRFNVRVVNQGSENANNVTVKVNLSSGTAPTATINADNAGSQTDFVNLSPGGAKLNFVAGSAKKYGPPDCFSGCAVSDNIVTSGISLGNVEPSEVKSFQVTFEADVVGFSSTNSAPKFRAGNIFDGGNRTDRVVNWEDPIAVDPGEVVEFRVTVINDGNATAKDVSVKATLPATPAKSIKPQATISGAGATTVNDLATVNVSGNVDQKLVYLPGHTIKWGPGCTNGCSMPDGITVHGISIGDVEPGTTNSYQITFKVYVSNVVETQPTSTCTLLSADKTSGDYPLTVTFTGSGTDSDGSIQKYEFDFGDGTKATQSVPTKSHTYTTAGTFTAKLRVQDSRGNWVGGGNCSRTITVSNPPTATSRCLDLVASSTNGTAPFTITFTGSGEDTGGDIQQYEFNFGDSSNGQSQLAKTSSNQATHTYNNSGNYTASLLVKDSRGNWVGGNGDACVVHLTANGQPTVQGASTPTTLPKTGPEAVVVVPFVAGAGYYFYRKFKLA